MLSVLHVYCALCTMCMFYALGWFLALACVGAWKTCPCKDGKFRTRRQWSTTCRTQYGPSCVCNASILLLKCHCSSWNHSKIVHAILLCWFHLRVCSSVIWFLISVPDSNSRTFVSSHRHPQQVNCGLWWQVNRAPIFLCLPQWNGHVYHVILTYINGTKILLSFTICNPHTSFCSPMSQHLQLCITWSNGGNYVQPSYHVGYVLKGCAPNKSCALLLGLEPYEFVTKIVLNCIERKCMCRVTLYNLNFCTTQNHHLLLIYVLSCKGFLMMEWPRR